MGWECQTRQLNKYPLRALPVPVEDRPWGYLRELRAVPTAQDTKPVAGIQRSIPQPKMVPGI